VFVAIDCCSCRLLGLHSCDLLRYVSVIYNRGRSFLDRTEIGQTVCFYCTCKEGKVFYAGVLQVVIVVPKVKLNSLSLSRPERKAS
jgi:hypothetical protein